ncbi:MAG: endonuclease/exonuclease/phosphatase family protein [Marinilabiliales bacterium]
MKKLLHYILVSFNIISLLALITAYLSIYISPADFWLPAFFGLAYPVILIINLLFAIYWAFRKRKTLMIITTVIIIVGISYITDYIQFLPRINSSDNNKRTIKVLSYNVKLFDLYNWKKNKLTRNEIFDLIKDIDADIICFQEFYKENTNNFKTLDTILQFQKAKYFHEAYSRINRNKYFFGIITLSKYPIINKNVIDFENSDNMCIYSDIVIDNDTIRVINTHLESIRFDLKDYELIDTLNLEINKQEIEGIKSIFMRLKHAFMYRAAQAELIAETIKNTPYPVILCGDLNDTPVSYSYHTIKGELKDSFKEAGIGMSNTYNGKFPSYRIDYIFHSPQLKCIDYEVIKKDLSDHYPITSQIIL